jgi:hypothetical protein
MFQKELYSEIPNVAVWPVLRKHLHLKVYKLSIVQHLRTYFIDNGSVVNRVSPRIIYVLEDVRVTETCSAVK